MWYAAAVSFHTGPPVAISAVSGQCQEYVMAKGTVAFFHDRKGYGFIETEDADDDIFFHMEDIGGPDVEEGQELEFEIEQTDEGPRATNVERL